MDKGGCNKDPGTEVLAQEDDGVRAMAAFRGRLTRKEGEATGWLKGLVRYFRAASVGSRASPRSFGGRRHTKGAERENEDEGEDV